MLYRPFNCKFSVDSLNNKYSNVRLTYTEEIAQKLCRLLDGAISGPYVQMLFVSEQTTVLGQHAHTDTVAPTYSV